VKYREGFVHKVYKSERGIGAPGKPVNRRDKNVRGWHLTLARHFLYLLDSIHLVQVVGRAKRSGADVVILDRYIYDELSNLNLRNPLSRAFVKFVHGFVPRPDVAYLLDADPVAAYARKPEYPVEFMKKCRRVYFDLAGILKTMTIIPALDLPEAKAAVLRAAERELAAQGRTTDLLSGRLSAA
jgi:thymidylate kinase